MNSERKLKVLFIILGNMYSGAEVVLNNYLFQNDFVDPYFLIIYNNCELTQKFISMYGCEKVKNLNFKYNQKMITFLPWIEQLKIRAKLKSNILRTNPDIIYLNNTTETMLCSKNLKEFKVICHIHDMPNHTRSPIRLFYTKSAINYCHTRITVSNACANEWNLGMKVVYNGISDENYCYRKISHIVRIGFVGSLTMRKGVDIIVDCLEELLDNFKEVSFSFAFNKIEDKVTWERLIKIKGSYPNRINIETNLDKKEIQQFYDNIDLLLVPSRQDPLPTVIMEAASRGVIVIGNNIDGIPELLNNPLLLINNCNSQLLLQKINELVELDSYSLQNINKNLYSFTKAQFSSHKKMNDINKIFVKLIKGEENCQW